MSLFIRDLLLASNFQSPLACFESLVLLLGALSLGLFVLPCNIARGSVRALAGVPLFFILGGALAGLLYYFGVGVFISGNILVIIALGLFIGAILSGRIKDLLHWNEIILLLSLFIVSYLLMFFGWGETRDGTIRAISGSWGDGVLHTLNAEAFKIRQGGNFAMPAFAGENFHEPFGYDFVSGLLRSLGFTIGGSFTLPASALLASLMATIGTFTSYLLRKRFAVGAIPAIAEATVGRHELHLRVATLVAMLLVVLGSGLQWIVMPTIGHLWKLSNYFGVHDPVWDKNEALGIAWANHLNTLVSQKHLLLAAAFLVVLSFILYWLLVEEKDVIRDRPFFAKNGRSLICVIFVIASGLLPFFHAHAFIAVAILWFVFWILRPKKKIFGAGVVVAVIALPIFLSFGAAVSCAGFTTLHLGYLVNTGIGPWILSWVVNLGLFLPITIYAISNKKWGRNRWLIAVPVIVLFVLGNIIQFQPYLWDNYKLFLFAWFLILPFFVAQLFAWITMAENKVTKIMIALVVIGIFITMVLTTISETATYFNFRNNYPLFTPTDRLIAKKLNDVLPREAVVLAGTNNYHKGPVTLTGRDLVLGYGGWIWTRGMDLAGREAQINKVLQSRDTAVLCQNLVQLRVTHIVVDLPTAADWQLVSSEFVTKAFGLISVGEQVSVLETSQFCQ